MSFVTELQNNQPKLKPTETVVKTLGDMFPEKKWKGGLKKLYKEGEGEKLNASFSETHGFLGDKAWKFPSMRVKCDADARPGYNSMKAHEYIEDAGVLRAKVRLFASLLKKSKATLAYTGAGISRASGIDDYATKVETQNRQKLASPMDALPTVAHKVMASLFFDSHLHYWIQQNHDGLPQNAGYPQHALNEIHGAWYDPSNPVVKMNGQLRSVLFEDLLEWEQKADLVLAFGTSLAGMNADRLVTTSGDRAKKGEAIGPIIVNLQQTACDNSAALRIFAPLDQVLSMVAEELECKIPEEEKEVKFYSPDVPKTDVWEIPYDSQGLKSTIAHSTLDLRSGAKLRITAGPYTGSEGEVTGVNRQGHYKATFQVQIKKGAKFRAPWPLVLGSWWVEAAVKGTIASLPVVTIEGAPESEGSEVKTQTDENFANFNGRSVVLSGVSMADDGAPPKMLLSQIESLRTG